MALTIKIPDWLQYLSWTQMNDNAIKPADRDTGSFLSEAAGAFTIYLQISVSFLIYIAYTESMRKQ